MSHRSREEYNAYMREYLKKRYHEKMASIRDKLGGKCAHCGSVEELEIDHEDRTTKVATIAKMWSYGEKLDEELKKCRLLCKSCHGKKSLEERGLRAAKGNHGSISSYRYCKCALCRAAHSAHHKEYMRKRRAALKKATLMQT